MQKQFTAIDTSRSAARIDRTRTAAKVARIGNETTHQTGIIDGLFPLFSQGNGIDPEADQWEQLEDKERAILIHRGGAAVDLGEIPANRG